MRKLILLVFCSMAILSSNAQLFKGQKATVAFHQMSLGSATMDSAFAGTNLYDDYRIQAEKASDFVLGIQQGATDSAWEIVSDLILNDFGMGLADLATLNDKATYSKFGYPNALIIRAVAKKDDSPLYIRISTEGGHKADRIRTKSGKLDLSSDNVKAYVSISLTFYDAAGKKLRKISETSFAEQGIADYKLVKLTHPEEGGIEMELSNLGAMLRKASAGLLTKYQDKNYTE